METRLLCQLKDNSIQLASASTMLNAIVNDCAEPTIKSHNTKVTDMIICYLKVPTVTTSSCLHWFCVLVCLRPHLVNTSPGWLQRRVFGSNSCSFSSVLFSAFYSLAPPCHKFQTFAIKKCFYRRQRSKRVS